MARTRYDEPDDDDGDDYDAERDYDPDDPETYPQGLYADDERAVVPCPHCRAEIDEESEQCPKCGMFITEEDQAQQGGGGKSVVWIVLMTLAMLAALSWVIAG